MSDLISRQAAIDALDFEIVHMTAYCDGKNEGNPLAQYNKGLEDGKKAIEALPSAQPEKVYTAAVTLTDEQVKEAVEEAKNAVLSVIKPEPHWTPCSEELPKENGHYLVTFHQTATEEDLGFDMDDTDVRKMRYDTKHGWRTPRHIPSWINDAVVSTVLAWMPLPEPYKAIDAMRSLPSAQPVQWIPCSERLPEDDREVLAVSDGCVLIANWQGEWIKYIELEDDYTILEPVNINVQYWMELPKPPEVEE